MAFLLNRSIQFVLLSIFSIGLFCIGEINAGWDVGSVLGGGGGDLKQREFDYFKLSMQWPGTACRNTKRCCSSNGCCRGSKAPVEFTIHGLWPDYNDGTWPACCAGHSFDVKEISTLLDALNKYWPSFSCSSVSNCHGGKGLFWAHEWEKHGTCSSSVTKDEYSYFLTTLNLYFKYNVTASRAFMCYFDTSVKCILTRFKGKLCYDFYFQERNAFVGAIFTELPEALQEAGYVASNTEKYPVGGIISAIQNAFHATPELQCKGDAVEELRLCFYKDFKPRDCAADSNRQSNMVYSKSSCPKYVSLPAHVSSRLENAGTEVSSTLKSSI